MSTLDISSASFILLPQMLFANGFSLKLSLLNCTLDKENDTFGASKAKNTMCSKLENNQEKSVIDKSLSGIFINNRSSLMSYEDYQNILDRITLRLDNIVQEASTRDGKEGSHAEERIKTHFKSDNQWTKRWIESTKKRGLIIRNRKNGFDSNISKSHILNEFINEDNSKQEGQKKSEDLYSDQMPLLNKRIGYPLMVNSRSEYGVHFNRPKSDINKAQFDEDISYSNKNKHKLLSKLEQKEQTKKSLQGGWKIRSSKTDKQKRKIGSLKGKEYKSSCCKNKAFKSSEKSFLKNNILHRKQNPFSKQTNRHPPSITFPTDDANEMEGSNVVLDNQYMHHHYINGMSNAFSSGSWAALNYLKILPTPTPSPSPNLSTNLVSESHMINDRLRLKNNKEDVHNEKRELGMRKQLPEKSQLKTDESRKNSIFDFEVHVPNHHATSLIVDYDPVLSEEDGDYYVRSSERFSNDEDGVETINHNEPNFQDEEKPTIFITKAASLHSDNNYNQPKPLQQRSQISIIGVNAWRRNWKKNMKSLFVIKMLLLLNHWFTSTWTEFKYSIGKLFLRGIVPDSYWNSIPRDNSLKKRHHHLIKSPNYLKNGSRNQYSGPIQKHYPIRRQFENVRISLTSEIIFSVFLLIILFVAGFILGYNFSEYQSSLFFGKAESTAYPSSALSNTDTKTITTYSNSSVTNTNNDRDTITNTVSSG